MLQRVGLFGVRRRINQIVAYLNGDSQLARLGRIETTLDAVSSTVLRLENRVRYLEKGLIKQKTFRMLDQMAQALDEEAITHALEAVEDLDRRVSALEPDEVVIDDHNEERTEE